MIITYHGGHCVKISFGDRVIAVNPARKSEKLSSSFGADIALSSANLSEVNGFDNVSRGDKEPFRIDGPGEYEISGIMFKGVGLEVSRGADKFFNTMYSFSIDDISCVFLGLVNGTIPAEKRENLGSPDIVFVGLEESKPSDMYKLAVSFDPGVIIPVGYDKDEGLLKQFIKESGENPKAEEKLVFKKKDLVGKEAEVFILTKV